MMLESLANEILLNMFEFLEGVDLLRTFHRLNTRFDNLLFTHFRSHSLNFQSVSKTDFDIICHQHLPSILDGIASLRLSEDDETPQQAHCFSAHNLSLNHFTCLKSLSLHNIRGNKIMDNMMNELRQMTSLIHLGIYSCHFQASYFTIIWSLPRLMRCKLMGLFIIGWSNEPTVRSLSLQNVFVQIHLGHNFSLERILKHTPQLRSLGMSFDPLYHPHQPLSYDALSIETLDLCSDYSYDVLNHFLKHVPNLSQLKVEIDENYIDGHGWEKLITDYLPKLKVFRLRMIFDYPAETNAEQLFDQILDAFGTNFWIKEHKWFVRCYWTFKRKNHSFKLYTLPHKFSMFVLDDKTQFKSTDPHDISYVHSQLACVLPFRCSHIDKLWVVLPLQEKVWSVVSSFDQLSSISVSVSNDVFALSQMEALLGRAPRLYSLTFFGTVSSHILKLTSKSIRRLDLSHAENYLNKPACITLCHSPLGIQCEVLLIKTNDRQNIPYLVRKMKNLRALYVTYNDRSTRCDISGWLQQRLPTNCSISRTENFADTVRLWIR